MFLYRLPKLSYVEKLEGILKTITFLVAIGFLLPSICLGGWIDKQGKPVPDEPHMKSVGEFGAQLILTDKEKENLENWNTPSETVNFSTTNTIKKNHPITAFVIFSGCGVDAAGNCNLVGRYKIYQPDGAVYADLPYQEIWVNKPVPPNHTLGLSVAYVKVIIEPHEQLGQYVVQAEVVDRVRNIKVDLESTFEATE